MTQYEVINAVIVQISELCDAKSAEYSLHAGGQRQVRLVFRGVYFDGRGLISLTEDHTELYEYDRSGVFANELSILHEKIFNTVPVEIPASHNATHATYDSNISGGVFYSNSCRKLPDGL